LSRSSYDHAIVRSTLSRGTQGAQFALSLLAMLTVGCGSATAPSSGAKSCAVTTTSVVLKAGDTLRMKFTVLPSANADILSYEVDYLPNPLVPGPSLFCRLFVGDRLLGEDAACVGNWQSTTASVRFPRIPSIDFSPIAAGTSEGRIDFIVSGGSIVFDGKGTISLGHAIMTDSGPTITYVAAGIAAPLEVVSVSCP
jgi:hypothetical protein